MQEVWSARWSDADASVRRRGERRAVQARVSHFLFDAPAARRAEGRVVLPTLRVEAAGPPSNSPAVCPPTSSGSLQNLLSAPHHALYVATARRQSRDPLRSPAAAPPHPTSSSTCSVSPPPRRLHRGCQTGSSSVTSSCSPRKRQRPPVLPPPALTRAATRRSTLRHVVARMPRLWRRPALQRARAQPAASCRRTGWRRRARRRCNVAKRLRLLGPASSLQYEGRKSRR